MDVSVSRAVSFERLAHLVVVPVTLDGVERSFVTLGAGAPRVVEGVDETGHRYFAVTFDLARDLLVLA